MPLATLTADTYQAIYTPQYEGTYAFGWITAPRNWASGMAFTHSGSNTTNYCTTWLAPKKDFAVLVCTNTGIPAANQACDAAAVYLFN